MNKNYPDPGKVDVAIASSTDFTGVLQNLDDTMVAQMSVKPDDKTNNLNQTT